jgi:hypothetical protein
MYIKIIFAGKDNKSSGLVAVPGNRADLAAKIGESFEILMDEIAGVTPKDFLFGIAIPNEAIPLIDVYSKENDIDFDIVLRSVLLAWTIDKDNSQDALYPMHKFTLQQLLRNINRNEASLVEYLSRKIGNSRFKDALELQDIDGVKIYGEDLIFNESPKKNKISNLIKKLTANFRL